MKKLFYFFIFSIAFTQLLQAQLWSRVLGTGTDDEDFKSICRTANGDLLIAGNRLAVFTGTGANTNDKNILVVRMDGNGNTLWEREYGTNNTQQSAVEILEVQSSTDVIVVGQVIVGTDQSVMAMRINANGNMIWRRFYNVQRVVNNITTNSSQYPNKAIFLENGNIAVAGIENVTGGASAFDGFVMVINPSNGNLVWTRGYDISNTYPSNWFYGLTQSTNGDIIAYGAIMSDFTTSFYNDLYIRINALNGNVISGQEKPTSNGTAINSTFVDGVALPNNELLLMSSLRTNGAVSSLNFNRTDYFLTRVGANNQVIWCQRYHSGGLNAVNDEPVSLRVSGDTAYVMGFTNVNDTTVTNVDPTLTCIPLNTQNPLWAKRITAQDAAFNNGTNYVPKGHFVFKPGNQVIQAFTTRANPFAGEPALGQNIYLADVLLSGEVTGCSDFTYPIARFTSDTNMTNRVINTVTLSQTTSNATLDTLVLDLEMNPICGYVIQDSTLQCALCTCCGNVPTICVPLTSIGNVSNGIIGMDFCMSYDVNMVHPTGNVTIDDVVLNGNNANIADFTINTQFTNPGELHVSIFYTGLNNYQFTGSGDICCVEFEMLPGFTAPNTTCFGICELIESYSDHILQSVAAPGCYTLVNDTILDGRIIYWNNESRPIPNTTPTTDIRGVNATCASPSATVVHPNTNGWFAYNTANGSSLTISRETGTAPVMNTINGMDCHLTSLVTTQNNVYFPNPYQVIAMDVNMDDAVSAGDITLMRNRILQLSNNYNAAGREWRFVDDETVMTDASYQISTTFPSNDNSGYSYLNVPFVPTCMEVPVISNDYCSHVDSVEYHGVLLGDANGGWVSSSNLRLAENPLVETFGNDKIIFDLTMATANPENCTINIPVRYESQNQLLALDFEMDYKENSLNIDNVLIDGSFTNSNLEMQFNDYQNEKLLLTSYINGTTNGILTQNPVFWISVKTDNVNSTEIIDTMLGDITAYLNGNAVEVSIIGTAVDCQTAATGNENALINAQVVVYPQPANDLITVEYPKEVIQLSLFNTEGKKLQDIMVNPSGKSTLNMEKYSQGLYLLQINQQIMRKIVK